MSTNEEEIFDAVRVEVHPDHVAVWCVEGGEIETALDGVEAKFEHEYDDSKLRCIVSAGDNALCAPYRAEDKIIYRFSTWPTHGALSKKRTSILCVANITERLHSIERSVLVVYSKSTLNKRDHGTSTIRKDCVSVVVHGCDSRSVVFTRLIDITPAQISYITSVEVGRESFTIYLNQPANANIDVQWWCVTP